ncbi:hypothetical protein SERLADRAFT_469992, partial [Serpula lacrymans var. lacrymans S7.9]
MVVPALTETTTSLAEFRNAYSTIYVGLAGFTILVWDHLITFDDEVEFIWNQPKGRLIYLFFFNRYITPL